MNGVVLAAGEGTRLRPRTNELPKPLIEVDGEPILTHCFETLLDLGIEETVVVVGYKKDTIRERYGDRFRGLDLQYAHQAERKGLAHALSRADPFVNSDFVVMNGDNVYSANLSDALAHHRHTEADITVPVKEVPPETASEGAVCELDQAGTVTGLVEKPDTPPSRYVPTAFYVLPPEIFPACRIIRPSERGEFELPDAIDLLIHAGYAVETVPFEGWKVNVNTESDIERAERKLASDSEP
jgi:glucose-1-phosphate thymidylyltransferase